MKAPKRLEGFSKNGSDLFKIAVLMAGFDRLELMMEVHKRSKNRATIETVAAAMHTVRQRHLKAESGGTGERPNAAGAGIA